MSADSADFTYIKNTTKATSGNISVQIDKLEKAKYIKVKKGYKGKVPQNCLPYNATRNTSIG